MKVVSRKDAREAGQRHYFTGEPCRHGHIAKRFTGCGKCFACHQATQRSAYRASCREARQRAGTRSYAVRKGKAFERPWYACIASARHRSKQLGLAFDIDEDYLFSIWPEDGLCPILGVRMVAGKNSTAESWSSPSLDRIIPERGYVRGNVAFMSKRANTIKSNVADPAVFRRLADWLESHG